MCLCRPDELLPFLSLMFFFLDEVIADERKLYEAFIKAYEVVM